jgi:sporulation protein YlmC with PRC-barrel domain
MGSSSAGSSPAAAPPAAAASSGGAQSGAATATASNGGAHGQFLTQLQGEQILGSKLIGTTVVSANNESVGDVNDVILDRNGQVMAVVVGVGGFLGIGEKDVAVPFSALDFAAAPGRVSSDTTPTAVNSPATTGSTGATQHETASNRQTATTGNTGNAGRSAVAGAANSNDSAGGVPNRVVLKMTKAELQAAPTFHGSDRGTVTGGSNDGGQSDANAGRK